MGPLYSAIFGDGCATVGGASRCGEKALSLVELKTMVGNNPRSSTVDRVLLAEGPMADTVVNHYATTNTDGSKSHGAVIHTVANGLVQQSFWYSDQSQHILAT